MSGLRVTLTLPGAGSRTFDLAVGKSATVGSSSPANVVFESRDPEIAPVHVRLSVTDRGLEVFQEAPGGFAVNGRKAKRAALRDGDALQVGASTMKVTIGVVPPPGQGTPSAGTATGVGGGGAGVGHGTPSHGTQGITVPHQPRSGEKPVVVLDARPAAAPAAGPPPLVGTAQAALAGAAGAGLAAQALAGATGVVPPPPAGTQGGPPSPPAAPAPTGGKGFVVVDALAPPPLHHDEKERERERSKHSNVEATRRTAELMFGTPMRGSALAQQVAIEKPDAGLGFHVAPLGGEDKTPVVGSQSQAGKSAATGSQKVMPGPSPYAMDQLAGDGGTSRRVLRGAAALQAIPGAASALGGPVPEKGGHSHRALPPRMEPSAADGGAHVIGGASTGEDLLHLLLFVETRAKSGTLIVRAQAPGGGPPLEGRLTYRAGAIVARYPASIDDMQFSWLVTIATLPLVEFRFVFSTPPRPPEGETPTKVADLIGQVIQRLSSR